MRCNRNQVAFDVRDVCFLKFGRTGSEIWIYYAQKPAIENPASNADLIFMGPAKMYIKPVASMEKAD